MKYRYVLEKHRNGKPKHICPKCQQETFVRYIDTLNSDAYVSDGVGKCDRELNCCYHYPPAMYFKDKGINYTVNYTKKPIVNKAYYTTQTVQTIPFKYYETSTKNRMNNLISYLIDIFDWKRICEATDPYFIGSTKDMSVIYPLIDRNGKLRTGKIMQYNPETGKRIKDKPGIDWLHSRLKKSGELPEDFKHSLCLFGEHLMNFDKNKSKPIGIVESEKTAIIASICMPNYVWMSSGGLNNLPIEKLTPLKQHRIILYPDTSTDNVAFNKWGKIMKDAYILGYDITITRYLEDRVTEEQRVKGYDLGDYLIDLVLNERNKPKAIHINPQSDILKYMISSNPTVTNLIYSFGLVEV